MIPDGIGLFGIGEPAPIPYVIVAVLILYAWAAGYVDKFH